MALAALPPTPRLRELRNRHPRRTRHRLSHDCCKQINPIRDQVSIEGNQAALNAENPPGSRVSVVVRISLSVDYNSLKGAVGSAGTEGTAMDECHVLLPIARTEDVQKDTTARSQRERLGTQEEVEKCTAK
jgi:hypothetical protein